MTEGIVMKRWFAGLAMVGVLALAGCETNGAPSRESLVASSTQCVPQRFEVYFGDGEARLTDAARQVIGMTATQLQGCEIRQVQVLGLADASGGAAANQSLSERRAIAVAEALAATGWPAPAFEVAAAGDEGATASTGVKEPLRRRTEVLVEAAPL